MTEEEEETELPPAVTDCVADCEFQETISTTASTRTDWDIIQISYFQMTNINITSSNGNILVGTGEIQIPWLNDVKVAVSFNNLQVNTEGRVFAGTARTIEDESDELNLSDLQHFIFVDQDQLPPEDIAALSQQVTTYKGIESLAGEDAAAVAKPSKIGPMNCGRQRNPYRS